ncbi:MAG: hypothetical protein WB729_00770 [Candidatus Sulfotelmatobacter sp.]
MDDHECGETKDRKPPGMGYHDVIPVWQSFFLSNIEKKLHETFEQRRANGIDILSSTDAVAVLRPEEDVAELLSPRLTEWIYAGFAITLLLAFYSQLNGGGSTWDKFDPILVMAFVFASYVLRRCMRANRWSI